MSPPISLTIHGTVRDSLPDGPGEPIRSAQIRVIEKAAKELSAVTDAEGRYRVEGLSSPYFQLQASKDGYQPAARVVVDPDATDTALDFVMTPIRRTLVGTVTESFPTETAPIPGARLEIRTGSNKGTNVVTDSNGQYSLPDVWGDFDVSVSKAEFEARTLHTSVDETLATLDIKLLPDDRPRRTSFAGRLCPPPPSFPGALKCLAEAQQDHYWLNVHRAGDMAVRIDFSYNGDYYTDWLRLEIRCGAEMIAARWFIQREHLGTRIAPPGTTPALYYFGGDELPLMVPLPRACVYEIKLFDYYGFKGPYPTRYVVDLDHPK